MSEVIRSSMVELAWSLWAELGVSGWGRRHTAWLVDPEPLIVFTAWLGDEDARLRDEVTDWCIRFAPMISTSRLMNLQEGASPATRERLGEIGKLVSLHSSVRWNLAGSARAAPMAEVRELPPFRPTNRSRLDKVQSPAQLSLRLRAILGVGARAEVVRALLEPPGTPSSAADLAAETSFKKRNVATALEMMHKGGVVESQKVRRELRFQLANPSVWRQLLGAIPAVWPRWHYILPLLADALDAVTRIQPLPPRVQLVELRIILDALDARAMSAQLRPPPSAVATVAGLEKWIRKIVAALGEADASVFGDVKEGARSLGGAASYASHGENQD